MTRTTGTTHHSGATWIDANFQESVQHRCSDSPAYPAYGMRIYLRPSWKHNQPVTCFVDLLRSNGFMRSTTSEFYHHPETSETVTPPSTPHVATHPIRGITFPSQALYPVPQCKEAHMDRPLLYPMEAKKCWTDLMEMRLVDPPLNVDMIWASVAWYNPLSATKLSTVDGDAFNLTLPLLILNSDN